MFLESTHEFKYTVAIDLLGIYYGFIWISTDEPHLLNVKLADKHLKQVDFPLLFFVTS